MLIRLQQVETIRSLNLSKSLHPLQLPPTGGHQLSLSFQERFGEVRDYIVPLPVGRG